MRTRKTMLAAAVAAAIGVVTWSGTSSAQPAEAGRAAAAPPLSLVPRAEQPDIDGSWARALGETLESMRALVRVETGRIDPAAQEPAPAAGALPWQVAVTERERERRPVVRLLGVDVVLTPVERRLVYVPVESRSFDAVLAGAEITLPWRLP